MDCFALCTASSYDLKAFHRHLKNLNIPSSLYRDVVHVRLLDSGTADVFFFPYGSAVFWGVDFEFCKSYLLQLKKFETESLEEPEIDEFTFALNLTDQSLKIVDDEILLPDEETVTKLSVSHGIAQSVKLSFFENQIRKTFKNTKDIPENLAKHGKISLSRKEIRCKMGELFIERSSINMHTDVLDTPDFFWEHTELEPYYHVTANYLDLKTRVEVLNQRLDVIHDLFDMLNSELNHQHSSLLEWTIIGLIVTEVFLTLLKDVFKVI